MCAVTRYGPVTTDMPDFRGDSEDDKKMNLNKPIQSNKPGQLMKAKGIFGNNCTFFQCTHAQLHTHVSRKPKQTTEKQRDPRPTEKAFKAPKWSGSNNRKTSRNPMAVWNCRYEWSHQLYRSSPTSRATYPPSPSPSTPFYPSPLLLHSPSL
jgi:hypothetical protein